MVKIFLDAGHGGKDPGATANNLKEKDLTLKIALGVGRILEDHGVQVFYSRQNDKDLSLQQRTDLANRTLGRDGFFISFHINSASGTNGTGFETFSWNGTSANTKKSTDFQNIVHTEIMNNLKPLSIKDRGKKKENFHVVRESWQPALLIENLFVNNPTDATLLKTKLTQIILANAKGILKGLGIAYKISTPKTETKKGYRVQVGYFENKTNAENLAKELKAKGFPAIVITE